MVRLVRLSVSCCPALSVSRPFQACVHARARAHASVRVRQCARWCTCVHAGVCRRTQGAAAWHHIRARGWLAGDTPSTPGISVSPTLSTPWAAPLMGGPESAGQRWMMDSLSHEAPYSRRPSSGFTPTTCDRGDTFLHTRSCITCPVRPNHGCMPASLPPAARAGEDGLPLSLAALARRAGAGAGGQVLRPRLALRSSSCI